MNRRSFLKGVASALVATRLLFPLKGAVLTGPQVPNTTLLGAGMLSMKRTETEGWVEIGTVTHMEIRTDPHGQYIPDKDLNKAAESHRLNFPTL